MSRLVRASWATVPSDEERYRPLYARALGLRFVNPGGVLCFLFFEGSVALAVLLALAELVTWWSVLVLPAAVAAMVKLNDMVAEAVVRTAALVPEQERDRFRRQMQPVVGRATVRSVGTCPAGSTRLAEGGPSGGRGPSGEGGPSGVGGRSGGAGHAGAGLTRPTIGVSGVRVTGSGDPSGELTGPRATAGPWNSSRVRPGPRHLGPDGTGAGAPPTGHNARP